MSTRNLPKVLGAASAVPQLATRLVEAQQRVMTRPTARGRNLARHMAGLLAAELVRKSMLVATAAHGRFATDLAFDLLRDRLAVVDRMGILPLSDNYAYSSGKMARLKATSEALELQRDRLLATSSEPID